MVFCRYGILLDNAVKACTDLLLVHDDKILIGKRKGRDREKGRRREKEREREKTVSVGVLLC